MVLKGPKSERPAVRRPVNEVWIDVIKLVRGHQHLILCKGKRQHVPHSAGLLDKACDLYVYPRTPSMDWLIGQFGISERASALRIQTGREGAVTISGLIRFCG